VHGAAEDVDDIDLLVRPEHFRELIEARHRRPATCTGRRAKDRLGRGRHRNDPVAEALQRPGDAVTRTGAVGREADDREADDRDDVRVTQQPGDLRRRWVCEHRALSLAEALPDV